MKQSIKKLITIEDLFFSVEHGVIISGTNTHFDTISNSEIISLIGNHISMIINNKKKSSQVKRVDISISIIGKKNINICLGKNLNVNDIMIGLDIFTAFDEP